MTESGDDDGDDQATVTMRSDGESRTVSAGGAGVCNNGVFVVLTLRRNQ